MTTLSIVVPCYNEEAALPETSRQLLALLSELQDRGRVSGESRLWLVDDGSSDSTWTLIAQLAASDDRVRGLKLSRNHGHQLALLAGLAQAGGDVVVTIDADLQDDIRAIDEMLAAHADGHDIVYGVRARRETDSRVKRVCAETYYRLLASLGVNVVFNHADFRLMSRRALDVLEQYEEVNLFLRGIIPTIGLPTATVSYDRSSRIAGETKYPFRRMASLAIDGITSFSAFPLRAIAALGIAIFIGSLGLSAWVLWAAFFNPHAVPGWASSVLPMYFLGGVQLLSLGVLGEYVAKTYLETKRRPRFIVEKVV